MDTTDTSAPNGHDVLNPLRDAYLRWKPVSEAIPKELLLTVVNVDVPSVVPLVRGAAPKFTQLRAKCVEHLPKADPSCFDNAESQALALAYTHGLHQSAQQPVQPLQEMSAQAVFHHDLLSSGLSIGIKRGLLPGQALSELRGPVGYKNQAADLVAMVAMARDHWSVLGGRIGLTETDLNEAESLAYQMYGAIGERDQLPAVVAVATEARQRMFTLFMQTYDDLRRVIGFLRWKEGDADEIAPSVYSGRKRSKGDVRSDSADKHPDTHEATHAAAQTASAAPAPTPAKEPVSHAPVGMPGSSPLMDAE